MHKLMLHDMNSESHSFQQELIARIYALYILHAVLIHIYIKLATNKIKTFTYVTLKTAR